MRMHLLIPCIAMWGCAAELDDPTASEVQGIGPPDDAYEQNDTPAGSSQLGAATTWPASSSGNELALASLISRPGDPDYFEFTLPARARVDLTVSPSAPIQLTWWSLAGGSNVIYSGTISTPVSLSPAIQEPDRKLPAGTHRIRVTSNQDGPVSYSLTFFHVPDGDGDGTPDPTDLCPNLFNIDQDDHDGDGLGNACDTDCTNIVCEDTSATGPCQGRINLGDDANTPFYRTHRLMVANACITRAIFYVHGSSRSPTGGYDALVDTADANGALSSTLIAAPWFQAIEDCTAGTCPEPDRMYWDPSNWAEGGDGFVFADGFPTRIHSTYEYMDALIELVTDQTRFPNLREVIVTGHSAGGQYTQRYAAGGLAPNSVPSGIDVRFLPANPSSYMLLHITGVNPLPGSSVFDILDAFTYKYGLLDRNRYMELLTASETQSRANPLVDQYLDRDVTYLIGSEDYCDCNCFTASGQPCDGATSDGTCICGNAVGGTCPNGNGNLACGDEALMQGETRLDRAYNYIDHLDANFGHGHQLVEVPGVDHSSSDMMSCDPVPQLLFGWPAVEGPDC